MFESIIHRIFMILLVFLILPCILIKQGVRTSAEVIILGCSGWIFILVIAGAVIGGFGLIYGY